MAIFKRRDPAGIFRMLKEMMWPSMGWVRAIDYYRHRLFRGGDSIYRVTAGLATGISVSFTPLLGTHFIQGFFFTWILRGSLLASAIGTVFGNPWTFPFIFFLTYKTGVWVCALFGYDIRMILPEDSTLSDYHTNPIGFIHMITAYPWRMFLPLMIGGYTLAVLSWPVSYGILYYPVRMMHQAYHLQKSLRQKLMAFHKKDRK